MEKHKMDAQGKQTELAFKQQDSSMKLQSSQMEHQIGIQQMAEQGEIQKHQAQDTHTQTMQHGEESHKVDIENMKRQGAEKEKIRKKAEVRKKNKGPKA